MLMLTIPIVINGVMRYLQLIYEKMRANRGESTTYRRPLIITAAILVLSLFTSFI